MILLVVGLVVGVLILTVLVWKRRLVYIICKTLPRDVRGFVRAIRLFWTVLFWTKNKETVAKVFSKLAKKYPNKVAYYYEDQQWTYQQLDDFSNRIANYFKSQGYKKGDSMALLLENRPEYIGIWLGLSKIGVVTALINTNLVSSPLVHSILAANNIGLVFGTQFFGVISEVEKEISDVKLYQLKEDDESLKSEAVDLKKEIQKSSTSIPPEMYDMTPRDKLLYIYTSGTTGLPKPAIIPNSRYMLSSSEAYFFVNLNQNDIIYNSLPLYHSAGGMITAGQSLIFGIPVVVKRKFSANQYWSDCQKYNCTVAVYIGELCRYLLAAHKSSTKIQHNVKKAFGNGLRPQIWEQFQDTFGIKEIYEFYGATEGNSQMVNLDGKVGAVGFIPLFARGFITSILVRCDLQTGEPIRNKNGLFTRCQPGEPGLMVGKINQKQLHKAFLGYADKKETQKKMVEDVMVKGDVYFNTGDILEEDEFGYFYFRDRTGDTFRWKGENVATCEVEAVISGLVGYRDATVYGVEVPNNEGRAGMAAIVDQDGTLDLKALSNGLKSKLPSYAIPIFLRTMDSVPLTGTFKLKKVELQKEGFDLNKIKEGSVFIFDSKNSEYVPLTEEVFKNIVDGKSRL